MSQFRVSVVEIRTIEKHPNADTLSFTRVEGETVIFRTGNYQVGDLAIYVPEDAIVPASIPGTEFLGDKRRIRAKRLRGIFSCGLLLPTKVLFECGVWEGVSASGALEPGQDFSEDLGITKWEEPVMTHMGGENESDPGFMPVYDMENLVRYPNVLVPGEEVVVTEKLHGSNGRFCFKDGRLWVGSHRCIKRESPNVWWQVARTYDLEAKLARFPDVVVYGEVFGSVQDLKYGCKPGEVKFAIFDMYNTVTREWFNYHQVISLATIYELPMVPLLYHGPYDPEHIQSYVSGSSILASHIREGVVIKPTIERRNDYTGRTIFKLISDDYRTRKNGTEAH